MNFKKYRAIVMLLFALLAPMGLGACGEAEIVGELHHEEEYSEGEEGEAGAEGENEGEEGEAGAEGENEGEEGEAESEDGGAEDGGAEGSEGE